MFFIFSPCWYIFLGKASLRAKSWAIPEQVTPTGTNQIARITSNFKMDVKKM